MEKKIILAADHAGFELKDKIKKHLQSIGYQVDDKGTNSKDSVDYPSYAHQVSEEILKGKFERGILVCGTGLGMSYAANRHKKIRAAVCTSPEMAKMASSHNNANVLCLGARLTDEETARKIIDAWLSTPYEGGRHDKRIELIDK